MSKEYFNKEKQEYENVDIPEDLDFLVRKTLKEGKRRKKHNTISKWSTAVASVTITFILLVNLFPKVAYAASLIPGLDKLVKLVTWDKGFDNAISEGLTQDINFKETKNGITLKVDGLAGDWKKLWVNYSIDDVNGNKEFSNGRPKYSVDIKVILPKEYEEKGCYYGNSSLDDNGESVLDIGFPQFIENFILEFKVYGNIGEDIKIGDERPELNYLATFEIPIKLDPTIFNSPLNNVTIDNNVIETSVGNILIGNIQSSKTRIVMSFNLQSEIYDYMGFENPRLVDNKGNEYKISNSYLSSLLGNSTVEFAGEIKEGIKSLKFECDGVYYAKKDNRDIVINLKEKVVEPNEYGFVYSSDDKGEPINKNDVVIKSDEVKSASFTVDKSEKGETILEDEGQSHYGSDEEGFTIQCYFKILDKNAENVTLRLDNVRKDITEPISAKLIK